MDNNCKWHRRAIVVVSIACATLAFVSCMFYNSPQAVSNLQPNERDMHLRPDINENITSSEKIDVVKKGKLDLIRTPKFPHCSREHIYTVLAGIIQELQVKQTMCTDSDCYKHNLNLETEDAEEKVSRGMVVVYVAVSLLLVSLIAAFLEVYKARKTPRRTRDKPELSRRCSLADLTVLRHKRRESMMRRDSVMHMSFDSATNHRVPLKLLGRMQSRPRLRVD